MSGASGHLMDETCLFINIRIVHTNFVPESTKTNIADAILVTC